PLQPAHLAPENINDVLDFAHAQKKRRAEKCGPSKRNCREEYRQLLEKPHVRPCIQPPVIRRPANESEQRTCNANFSECNQHLTRLEPARMPAHQRVEQKKIDRRDEAGGKRKAAMSPPQSEREQPVQKQVRSDGE